MERVFRVVVAAAAIMMPTAAMSAVSVPTIPGGWTTVSDKSESTVTLTELDNPNQVEQSFFRPERSNYGRFSRATVMESVNDARELRCNEKIAKLSGIKQIQKSATAASDAGFVVKPGTMVAADTSKEGVVYRAAMTLTASGTEGAYTLNNLFGLESDIIVNIDVATGVVSIPCQKVAYISGYGDLKICPVGQMSGGWGFTTDNLQGRIDSEGNITMNPWGLLITEGQYMGETMVIVPNSIWRASNTTFTTTDYNGVTVSYGGLVEQTSEREVTIYNLTSRFGEALTAEVESNGNMKIYPQLVIASSGTEYYCFKADVEEEVVYTRDAIDVTRNADGSYSMGGWCVARRTSPWAGMVMLLKGSTFTPGTAIKAPAPAVASFTGDGSQANPYVLKNTDDFRALAELVAAGKNYAGSQFILGADVDFSGYNHTPIGDDAHPFSGMFDGKGHVIKNFTCQSSRTHVGLFGYLGLGSSVSNLTLDNAKVSGNGIHVGTVAGYSEGSMTNVNVKGSVEAKGYMCGGLTSASEGQISNCSFTGNIAGYGTTGGITGYNYGVITDCHVLADMSINYWFSSTYSDLGGIVGTSVSLNGHRYAPAIYRCSVSGTLVDNYGGGTIGGIGGRIHYTTVAQCFNAAVINAHRGSAEVQTYTGGIAGWTLDASLTDCYNGATITQTGRASSFVGGVVGWLGWEFYLNGNQGGEYRKPSYMTNCFNSGQVISTSAAPYKGLYGTIYGASGMDPVTEMVRNSYFDNQISVFADSRFGRDTKFFTGASLPEGFTTDKWVAAEGQYPRLRGLENAPGADIASLPVTFANGQTVRKIMSDFTLGTSPSVTWALVYGNMLTQETEALKITGATVSLKREYAIDLLAAASSDGYSLKYYRLGVVPKVFDGEGTETSPYLIKTVSDFATLDKAVGVCDHAGDYFRVTADMDFSQATGFSGVGYGNYSAYFAGVLDGDGHTIKGMKIDAAGTNGSDRYENAGFICQLAKGGVVKNLTIGADCSLNFYAYSGAVVGDCNGEVINCRNYADITATGEYVGGIVGGLDEFGKVTDCYNAGNITGGTKGAGGIAAITKGAIERCANTGNIGGVDMYAGGIVGSHGGVMTDCLNMGAVKAVSNRAGGLAGVVSSVYQNGGVTNCLSTGTVQCADGAQYVGGLAGEFSPVAPVKNNYYDASVAINGAAGGISVKEMTGLSTSELISGKSVSGFDAAIWDLNEGGYPVLKAFAQETACQLHRSTYVNFPAGVSRANVTSNMSVSAAPGVVWNISGSDNFTINESMLMVNVPESSVAEGQLTASVNGKELKSMSLKSVPVIFAGQGSAESPFLIETVADMTKLAEFVASTKMDYAGYYFRLVNDLNYNSQPISLISGAMFQGDFDGNGKTISNYVNNVSTMALTGLFEKLGERGHIHDLTLDGMFFGKNGLGAFVADCYGKISRCVNKTTVQANNGTYAAGIAPWVYDGAEIVDCVNEGTIGTKAAANAAGITVRLNKGGRIVNCSNKGTITAGTTTKNMYAAGVVWEIVAGAEVIGCTNSGKVVGKSYLGGVAGNVAGLLKDCTNAGTFEPTQGFVGGVAQKIMSTGIIENCHNTADIDISGKGTVAAGVVVSASGSHTGYVRGCTNTGRITANGSVGGVLGKIESGLKVDSCFNYGAVTATTSKLAGGLAYDTNGNPSAGPSVISDCGNTAAVKGAESNVGGLLGQTYGDTRVNRCWNTGDVSVETTGTSVYGVGGIAGNHRSSVMTDCWNIGNVSTQGTAAGGIAGYCISGKIYNCLNLGDVKAETFSTNGSAGGITTYTTISSSVCNSINAGKVEGPARVGGLIAGIQSAQTHRRNVNTGVVIADSISAKNPSNNAYWCHNDNYKYAQSVDSLYYDSTVAVFTGCYDDSVGVNPMTTAKLTSLDISEQFVNYPNCYPMLAQMTDNGYAQLAAVAVVPVDSERFEKVSSGLCVGMLPAVTWSTSDNMSIGEDGQVDIKSIGDGWLKAEYVVDGVSLASKLWHVSITGTTTGADDVEISAREVVSQTYYDLNGRQIKTPSAGNVYIEHTLYNDGTVNTRKIAIN